MTETATPRAILAARVVLALALGGVGALLAPHMVTGTGCDFGPLWVGARALLDGASPYGAVARGPHPLYYPGPAVLLALPFARLPLELACALVAGLTTAVLAFALSATPWRLLALLSTSALHAIALSQWSPLALAAWFLPTLGALWVAKPQVGVPALAAHPEQIPAAVAIGGALLALSVAVYPAWPAEWLQSVRASTAAGIHVSPILRPGGFLLLAAAIRWRRPEARWLLAVAILPQTSVLYETLPLFVVPQTRREMATLTALSWVAMVAQSFITGPHGVAALTAARWPILLALLWLPAVLMVLRRPNMSASAAQPQPLAAAA